MKSALSVNGKPDAPTAVLVLRFQMATVSLALLTQSWPPDPMSSVSGLLRPARSPLACNEQVQGRCHQPLPHPGTPLRLHVRASASIHRFWMSCYIGRPCEDKAQLTPSTATALRHKTPPLPLVATFAPGLRSPTLSITAEQHHLP